MAENLSERPLNPFEITKATDFDDAEIAATWVDLPSEGGFRSLVDPTSPVTRFILGGKGSGRTHLLRYYSSRLQAMRLRKKGVVGLFEDGYVGVYVNSSTLNPGRFWGKGQDDDTWAGVFAYYVDAALALRMLLAFDEVWRACGAESSPSLGVWEDVRRLFDVATERTDGPIGDLRRVLRGMDSAINRAALSRELDVTIGASPGRLVFGTAEALGRFAGGMGRPRCALLLDEFENFSESQQRYLQTLIREKDARVSFVVGARTFGVRTMKTTSGERNLEGSEFETIELDLFFRRRRRAYVSFCGALIEQRLARAGLGATGEGRDALRALRECFVESTGRETSFLEGAGGGERKRLVHLRKQLTEHRPGGIGADEVDKVVRLLRCEADPVLEKIGVYLLYRSWYAGRGLAEAAAEIASERETFLGGNRRTTFAMTVGHFRRDMLAQLAAEYRQKQRYLGLGECIALSGGLPRGLLVVLKHVFRWAVFNGEAPFSGGAAIGEDSQRAGVLEAGRWFLTDQPGIGPYGVQAREAMERLGSFLRALRFADKPTESSACTVSLDGSAVNAAARATVEHCVGSSLLLSIARGHRGRNTRVRKRKLQVHPMLCPRWDLPTARRGVVELTAAEANVIFDSAMGGGLRRVVESRLVRMNAPFGMAANEATLGLRFDGGL